MFEDINKGEQFNYQDMCTEAVHEYKQIFNSNEWSPFEKGRISNEEAILTQVYMANIDSLGEKKSQALKYSAEGGNGGGDGHHNFNNRANCKSCNNNHENKVCFANHTNKSTHNLKSLYNILQDQCNAKNSGCS